MKLFGKSQKDVIVRLSESSDLESITEIHNLCFSRGWSLDDFMGFHSQSMMYLWSAQEVGGSLCGFNLLRQLPDDAEIISIGVHPNFQRLGIGEKLMRASINHLLSEGINSLFLEVSERNNSAISLYKHLGFSVISERKGYYGSGDSAVSALVMRLSLV